MQADEEEKGDEVREQVRVARAGVTPSTTPTSLAVAVMLFAQDRFLPVANISRIMKKSLPSNAKVAKDAKETVQECVSEFISFITSEYPPNPPCLARCVVLRIPSGIVLLNVVHG